MAARGTPSLPTQLHHTQQHNTPSALLQRLRGPLTELVQCGVCLNTMAAAHAFPCSHAICGLCAVEWMRRRPSCPTCRAPAEFSQAVPVPTLDALADALAPLLAAEERDDLLARRGAWQRSGVRSGRGGEARSCERAQRGATRASPKSWLFPSLVVFLSAVSFHCPAPYNEG